MTDPKDPNDLENPFADMVARLQKREQTPCTVCKKPTLGAPGFTTCDSCLEVASVQRWESFVRGEFQYARASIPDRFRDAVFGFSSDILGRVRSEDAVLRARERVGRSVVLVGESGTGKTTLACALFHAHLDRIAFGRPNVTDPDYDTKHAAAEGAVRRAATARYVRAWNLGESHFSQPFGQGLSPEEESATYADLLIIDDLGFESERASPVVVNHIYSRADTRKATIITTALDDAALLARYGEGFQRRTMHSVLRCR